jgi:hypothetical protein
MKVKWHLDNGLSGCSLEGDVELADDASTDDIEDAVREDMWNFLSLTWQITEPKS